MSVIISGDNGVSDVDGSAGTPAIRGTDANTGIFFGADQVGVATNGVERVEFGNSETVFNDGGVDVDFRVEGDTNANLLFVDAGNDRVGIGTSSPQRTLGVHIPSANSSFVQITNTTSGVASDSDGLRIGIDSSANAYLFQGENLPLIFGTNDAERARITSGGFFKASNTGAYSNSVGNYHELISSQSGDNVVYMFNTSANPYGPIVRFQNATPNNTTNYFEYYDDSTNLKAVLYSNGSWQVRANSYGGISDLKLKQDIVDAGSQWDDIKNLRVRKYRFKDEVAADPDYPSHLGVIAQEVEIVSPGLVFESPDVETNEDGEKVETGTVTKAVKYSILYMKAVKALQEAMERIETLEAKVAALEAK